MLEIFRITIERYQMYVAGSMHIALLLGALIYIACSREEKDNRRLFVGYAAFFGIIYFCPITAKIMMDYCIGRDVYWRMFWLLPMPLILSYTAVRAFLAQDGKLCRGVMLVALVLIITVTGSFVYIPGTVTAKTENLQKVPSEVSAVCEIIARDRGEDGQAKAAVPESLVGYVRVYDASIGLAYGRKGNKTKADKKIYEEMISEKPNFKRMIHAARREKCNYLVYYEGSDFNRRIEAQNFTEVGRTNGYIIYKDKNITNDL